MSCIWNRESSSSSSFASSTVIKTVDEGVMTDNPSATTLAFKHIECDVSSYLLWLDEFELHAPAGPGNEVWVGWVIQQSHQELPELQRASALVRWALAVQAGLLLDVTCNAQSGPLLSIFFQRLYSGIVHSGRTYLLPSLAPRRYHRRSASPLCQTCNLQNITNTTCIDTAFRNPLCSTFSPISAGTFSPVSVSQIAVLP